MTHLLICLDLADIFSEFIECRITHYNNNLDWGPVPLFAPWSTAASVADCTIPRFLNVPTLAARSLSRPQPAVGP